MSKSMEVTPLAPLALVRSGAIRVPLRPLDATSAGALTSPEPERRKLESMSRETQSPGSHSMTSGPFSLAREEDETSAVGSPS